MSKTCPNCRVEGFPVVFPVGYIYCPKCGAKLVEDKKLIAEEAEDE